ncbi:NADH dehydrogenase [ubiquinone] flavoprotein 3, mitochondrial isoform X1 [Dasypus novemcinctus]|uniref:NADH dehydrogenase [ubiquinone] flavoprotein 3, mitochondrial isoform X1 n=1 Tax=Dasypus novemcinctus TaxID=9361 RepID=UPI000328C38C|nr:NADH dehydrogenase [ubiquinone] flavoprotein 3, mitochondrial isoform X1 [Dasypus novemcinctus]
MASWALLRQGQTGVLKILLQEAPALRGLSSTCFLSTESGKSDKGLGSNTKKQSPPKNVVEPKERGKLPPTQTAAELSKKLPWPSSDPAVVNKAGTAASPSPDDITPSTDEGVQKFLSRKTLVEFPQKVSDSEPLQKSREVVDESSSSSSSSSDSESDEEGGASGAGGPRVASKATGGFPQSEASSKTGTSAEEKCWSQKTHVDRTCLEKPHQPKKKGTTTKQLEGGKNAKPKTATPTSKVDEDFLKQNVKEKQLQKIVRVNKGDKESHKPADVKRSADHSEPGLSSPSGRPAPAVLTEETRRAGRQLRATPETREENLEKQVPGPKGKLTSPLFKKENLGTQVELGKSKEASPTKEILEDQGPVGDSKTVPVNNKEPFDEKTPVLSLEEKGKIIQDSAAEAGDQAGTQATVKAAAPAEPFDNTTYKNLQHHAYSTFTFLDLNLELSKFRMPQPSSGRESPRH